MFLRNFRPFYAPDGADSGAGNAASDKKDDAADKGNQTQDGNKDDKSKTPELDEATKKAVRLYEALNDPARARQLVGNLAKNLGILPSEDQEEGNSQKPSKQTAKTTLADDIKKALGPGFEFAADPFTRAISAAVDRLVEEKTAEMRNEIRQTSQDRVSNEIEGALERLDKEYDLSKTISDRVSELMEEIPARKGQKPYDYLKTLVFQAASEVDEPVLKKSASRTNRQQRNAQDQFGNLRTFKGGGGSKGAASSKSGTMSLNDAILSAMDEIAG